VTRASRSQSRARLKRDLLVFLPNSIEKKQKKSKRDLLVFLPNSIEKKQNKKQKRFTRISSKQYRK